VLNPALTVSGKHRQVLFWLLGFAASYALLTRTLAPRWGAVGMGAAFSAVELAGLPLLAWMYTRAHARLEIGPVLFDIALGGGFTALLWMSSSLSPRLGAGGLMLYLSLWVARRRRILARVPDWISLTWRRSARGPSSVRVQ
jgi:O-antigen/teichoic acid export membrane protein